MTRPATAAPAKERGAVLLMSLVILLIITLLGLSSVQTTSMQERMARNSRDNNLAFQAAEAAIKDAELAISNYTSLKPFTAPSANVNGLYTEQGYSALPNWRTIDWAAENGGYITAPTIIAGVAAQPKYIVEFIKTLLPPEDGLNLNNVGQNTASDPRQIFRVTVYATGATHRAHVMLQSTYGKRF